MATQTATHISNAPVASFFAGIGSVLSRVFTALIEAGQKSRSMEARMHLIERLNAMSDAQLAELKIERDNIPAYVFRDLYYV
ncbi:hypothetical protein [Pseudosulfitobacter pseudonitzschiae]|uniref:Uncharacterized protein n=1 Tax=Pseudosulfitobacter pseudonitzschiae TaxID=1402135 RepID=A0A073JDJ7_9RHOB|nr:hypothetical protein [Pseudosulfitobacter pseudonitzschiae]KEJ95802.1 hypothetical protein SUH3_20040 [Pseudosulfitobacter pseudonitzschiae]MBM1813724.1 hypothetical protein [Pseudosulfitobacter pseudonitzschiae]MBM1830717.1 hypothetical protein [Pseudosulfitobacter pseudonitzschiae]MBM1835584.1 hypothetical protein [Pseudosulfitobacter pseudonitzschiae]MBM1840430.1 hypothetical protein [Pseudosulfitobacter pseudonitzschiae]